MKPYRESAERTIERAPEELRKEIIKSALPLIQPGRVSPVLTSYPRDIFRPFETSFPRNTLSYFKGLISDLGILTSDHPDDDLLTSDVKKKLADAKEQLIIKLSAEFGLPLKELRDNFFGYRWLQNGKYFTCIGPVMRYIEDNYYSFQYYLDTGELPTAERMAEERRFQARKMLVELMELFKPLVPADEMKDEADHLMCHAIVPRKTSPINFRNENVVQANGHATGLLQLIDSATIYVSERDSDFLSKECRLKLEQAKEEIEKRIPLQSTQLGSSEGVFWDSIHDGKSNDVRIYTTGFMPVLDWFLAYEKELKAEYADRESTFYAPPRTKVGVAQSIRQRFLPF